MRTKFVRVKKQLVVFYGQKLWFGTQCGKVIRNKRRVKIRGKASLKVW